MRELHIETLCALGLLLWAPLAHAQAPGAGAVAADDQAYEMQAPDPVPPQPPPPPVVPAHELICDNRQDEDGDGLADCADADCFSDPRCQAGGSQEQTNDACSDWIDNDGDGAVDCDDDDCTASHITACRGSWQGGAGGSGGGGGGGGDEIPELTGDMSVEDLIGNAGDADGERNDYLCSDGVDNDADGRTDCQDFGCRFDPSVTVCTQAPGFRFSVVAGISAGLLINETSDFDGDGYTEYSDPIGDVRVSRLQLRALGAIPLIQNSFFLINLRAERSVRITFAMSSVTCGLVRATQNPAWNNGLYPGMICGQSLVMAAWGRSGNSMC